jgi:hypothetical protein
MKPFIKTGNNRKVINLCLYPPPPPPPIVSIIDMHTLYIAYIINWYIFRFYAY